MCLTTYLDGFNARYDEEDNDDKPSTLANPLPHMEQKKGDLWPGCVTYTSYIGMGTLITKFLTLNDS